MIIKNIHLENWRCFRKPIEIEFSEGLNILYGPNESGKSTLIDSIRTIFFYRHTSQSEKIKSLIPWGTMLYPRATIIFSHNMELYRITKKFISPRYSLLEKLFDGKWERIAEGNEADEEVVKIIEGKISSRGENQPEHWGIGQTLWMVQGQPFVSGELNEATLSSLRRLIGAAIESEEEKELFLKISNYFLNIFTEKRREFKRDSEIARVIEDLQELEKEKERLIEIRMEKENIVRNIEDSEILLQKKDEKLRSALEEKEKLKKRVDAAYDHKSNREKLEEEIRRIRSSYEILKKQIDDIKENRRKIKDIESKNKKMEIEKSEVKSRLDEVEKEIESINDKIEEINRIIEKKEQERRFASIAHTAILEELELKGKEELLQKVNKIEEEIQLKQEKMQLLKAPSKEELQQIEEIHQKLHDIKTKLDAIGLTINAIAENNFTGKIYLDGIEDNFKLSSGEEKIWKTPQSVKIQIDNMGKFEIKSGSEDVLEMKSNLEELEVRYEEMVSPYGVTDLKSLQDLFQQKRELDEEIRRLNKEIERLTENGKEYLTKEITERRKRIELNWNKVSAEFHRKYSENKDKLAVREELSRKINDTEKEIEEIKKERKKVIENLEYNKEIKENLKNNIQELEKKIHGNLERLNEIKTSLNHLEEDGLALEEREKKLDEIASELDKKERTLQRYREEKKEVEDKPIILFEELEKRTSRLMEEKHNLDRTIAELNGRLNRILLDIGDLNKIEEEIEFLEDRYKKLEVEAKAVELLYDLMQFYRRQAIESLVNPVEKIMSEDLRELLGGKYPSVKFSEKVKPVSVEVSGWNIDAPIDELSFGTEEQIWFLFRLAVGKLLSSNERQLVVLDDPLTNTDLSRIHRALRILEEASNKLQIILITCDVDKYNGLSNAKFIPIQEVYGP